MLPDTQNEQNADANQKKMISEVGYSYFHNIKMLDANHTSQLFRGTTSKGKL